MRRVACFVPTSRFPVSMLLPDDAPLRQKRLFSLAHNQCRVLRLSQSPIN